MFRKKNWREELDSSLKPFLDSLIRETQNYRNSYKKAKNIADAQLWTASSILQKQMLDIQLRLKILERALKDSIEKDKEKKIKEAEREAEEIIKAERIILEGEKRKKKKRRKKGKKAL